jgi:hypothetical protein
MKVLNRNTGKEHNIDQKTFDTWIDAGIPIKIIEVEKPKAIVEKELQKDIKSDEVLK